METMKMFLTFLKIAKIKKKRKHKRRWKVNPINNDWVRAGYHQKVYKTIKLMDEKHFFKHNRMPKKLFELLLALMKDGLKKPGQRIGAEERLAMTLFYLAHGNSTQTIAWKYKLGKTTVRQIILETCDLLWNVLAPIYLSEPSVSQYENIASDFGEMWNMPNCVGAIDGKHIAIKCPNKSGSAFFNYKKFYSIVLMAACDAKYTFTAVSVGSFGSESDGGVFRVSACGKDLLEETLALPKDKSLPNSSMPPFQHYFVGDAAFPLKRTLLRPYPGINLTQTKRVFNYRLSRARRTIENAFGILSARWRILLTTLELMPENIERIVLACVVLHNFIMLNDMERWNCPANYAETGWRADINQSGEALRPLEATFNRRSSERAVESRNRLAEYFMNEGAVSFQEQFS